MSNGLKMDWIASNTVEELLREAGGKKVVFWGAGNEAIRVLSEELNGISLDIAYFCDRVSDKWAEPFMGREVKSPDALRLEDPESVVVVICCRYFLIQEIVKSLREYGDFRFFVSILFDDNTRRQYLSRFSGEYTFIDRRKNCDKLLVVLTGYKEFLWDVVYRRIIAFLPDNIDVCLVLPGKDHKKLRKLAEKQGWSYLSTADNKLSTAQNIAISLHENAKLIYKLDEDMFIPRDYFADMERTFYDIGKTQICRMGFLAPLIPINSASYFTFLKKLGLENEYCHTFGREKVSAGTGILPFSFEIHRYLWKHSLPFDDIAEAVKAHQTEPVTSPYRFSIGAILFERELWEQLIGFGTGRDGETGKDEEHLCYHCMEQGLAAYIDTNILAGHFAYSGQTKAMTAFYGENKELFDLNP